jgi:hypothetical protein
MKLAVVTVALVVSGLLASSAQAGPVIIGGDDLADHGGTVGNTFGNPNEEGWLYIEKAIDSILAEGNITCENDGSIAALGSAESTAGEEDWGAAVNSAASKLGKTINFHNGAPAMTQFFSDLAAGNVNPAMIWISAYDPDTPNGLDAAEGAVLTANAQAIAAYVNSGCGLMAHGCDDVDSFDECTIPFGWLSTVLPGLTVLNGCQSNGAVLTPAGQTAFPGLSDSDIGAGACHNHFAGDFGTLKVLGLDGETPRRPFILGGGAGTIIAASNPAPVMGGWAFGGLAGFLLLGGAWLAGRKARRC